ncbi:MBL fold metallo-hydrolase [Candidatus Saccharibacteria bacterium]|nr:MBL fold metallo-hydrolase [Candidatus Saccharibacteria bacterium]
MMSIIRVYYVLHTIETAQGVSMKLIKYEHACFTLENNGEALVVDPGGWSRDFVCPSAVVGVVITHEHPDHFISETLHEIIAANPDAVIYALATIAEQLEDLPTQVVAPGATVTIGPAYQLTFVGGQHAEIHPDIPRVANIDVLINDTLYYPGDSFDLPQRHVEWLALPVAAPWLKLSDSINFARAVAATHVFPVHDAVLSDEGKGVVDALSARLIGTSYQRLTEPVEL